MKDKMCCRRRGAPLPKKRRMIWGVEDSSISRISDEMRTALTTNSCTSQDQAVFAKASKCVVFWEMYKALQRILP